MGKVLQREKFSKGKKIPKENKLSAGKIILKIFEAVSIERIMNARPWNLIKRSHRDDHLQKNLA